MKRDNRMTVMVFSIIVLTLSAVTVFADYPLLDTITYSADPSCLEYNGVLYTYWSNDDNNNGGYQMHQITCLSTSDLKNWTNHGQVFDVPTDCSWATYSWAPSVVYRDGYFWMYFGNNAGSVGVAKSTSPTGPFKDAKGSALINSSTPGASGLQWYFDPAVFVDDDGQVYLYFGGGSNNQNARVIKLNSDMISISGSAVSISAPYHFEASYMHKYNGKYYYSYSNNPGNGQKIQYMMSDNPMTGWVDKGTVLNNPPDNGNNNHHSIFQFKGNWYIGYHNRYVAKQQGIDATYKRNAAMDQLFYNADGTMQLVNCTKDGLPMLTGTVEPTAVPTTAPTPGPTEVPTATPAPTDTPAPTTPPTETVGPTTPPTETPAPTSPPATGCTCTAKCDAQTAISVPFTYDGAGEYCWTSSSLGSYVNSWNCDAVNINGTNCTNTYVSSSSISAIGGVYYIYYKGSYAWSHIEIK